MLEYNTCLRPVQDELDLGPYIETYSGFKFYLLNPTPDMVSVYDIAHALSQQCRFTGHCRHFYSVAEHSVHVSNLVPEGLEMAALLHDASEAYLTDVASPVKPLLEDYKPLEHSLMTVIYQHFQIPLDQLDDEIIKDADRAQLKEEAKALMTSEGRDWVDQYPTALVGGFVPQCWEPEKAKLEFYRRFYELYSKERQI